MDGTTIINGWNINGTAQFKLDRTHVQHGLDITHFSFYTHASMHVHKFDDVKPVVHSSCVHTRCVHNSLQCMSGTHMPNLNYMHTNCKLTTAE